ncbi:MAG: DUF1559 domain-containing protein [Pirellulales bacterium]
MPRLSRGFTLVELLVVIAIIGILVALLLPAIQAAREAARKSQCKNNFRQLGLAIHLYDDNRKILPAGAWWTNAAGVTENRGTILIRLLPYLEEKALYDAFDLGKDGVALAVPTNTQTFPGSTKKLAETVLPVFLCPTDAYDTTSGGVALHNYAASSGPTKDTTNSACSCSPDYNSYGTHPYSVAKNFGGVFHRRSDPIKTKNVSDGLSKTIDMGEVRRGCSTHIRSGWAASNNGQGLTATIIPINFDSCDDNGADGCNKPCNWRTELGFKSMHAGGAFFLMGDDSVHFFEETIDHATYQLLGGKSDGKPVNIP